MEGTPETRVCRTCGEEKAVDQFYRHQSGTSAGRVSWHCKTCTSVKNRLRYESMKFAQAGSVPEARMYRRKHVSAAAHRLRTYGLTEEDYAAMWERADGRCELCGEEPRPHDDLVIDHDHRTGELRGLVHRTCNIALGKLNDDVGFARAVLAYLEAPPAQV